MKNLKLLIVLSTLLAPSVFAAGNTFTVANDLPKCCTDPCGGLPGTCCSNEADKKACTGDTTTTYSIIQSDDGQYKAVKQ